MFARTLWQARDKKFCGAFSKATSPVKNSVATDFPVATLFVFGAFFLAYAQLMVVGLGSSMTMGLRKDTALRRPSSMLIRLSSCSMDSTRS